MGQQVLTAPIAEIKHNGVTVGKMRNIRVTESFRRMVVKGLGELTPQELPVTDWTGTLTCSYFEIDFQNSGLPAITRRTGSLEDFKNQIFFDENGLDIVIYKKVRGAVDPTTGLVGSELQEVASIEGCFLDREGMDLSEGQVAGHDQDFTYINPIQYAL